MQSFNEAIGIPNERAKKLTKKYGDLFRPLYETYRLSESKSFEIIKDMKDISELERMWLMYHIGGTNRLMLYGKSIGKQVVIQYG